MWRVTSGSNVEDSFEVNHAEHTEVDILDVVNDFQKRTIQIMINLDTTELVHLLVIM
jgi:hypothetical protein